MRLGQRDTSYDSFVASIFDQTVNSKWSSVVSEDTHAILRNVADMKQNYSLVITNSAVSILF